MTELKVNEMLVNDCHLVDEPKWWECPVCGQFGKGD